MVKTFKCLNCKRVYKKKDDTVMVKCACGYPAMEVDSKTHETIKNCKKCKVIYNPEEDGRGNDMDNGLCCDCDLADIVNKDNEREYSKINTTRNHDIRREDVVCSVCGGTLWTDLKDGFLTCECGHEQEDM